MMTAEENNPFAIKESAQRRHLEYQEKLREDMRKLSLRTLENVQLLTPPRGEFRSNEIYEANSVKDSVTGQTTSVGPRFVNYEFPYMGPQGSLIPSLSLSEPKKIFGEIVDNTLEEEKARKKKRERKKRKEQADTPEDGEEEEDSADSADSADSGEEEEEEEEE